MKKVKTIFLILVSATANCQTFTRVSTGSLVNTPGDSRSVNWIDINNDSLIDCMITNGPSGGQNNFLYINAGGGNFTSLAGSDLVSDNAPSDGATWADADNDGDEDCFVVNWYNVNNLFYFNDGNSVFSQVTSGSFVNDGGYSETASWGDYDNDNLVDLYVTNSAGMKKNFLYHNDGNGDFTKIISGDVVNDAFASRCVNWTDIDNDNDLDLFVTNEGSQNENIYRNDGGGAFVKLTAGPLLNNGGSTMSSSWGDYDNDGDLDVFLANDGANNSLFRNDGNFVFTKITNDTVSNSGGNSFSSAWSDIDNDGDIDLFVTNSFTTGMLVNNFLYINNGNGTFNRAGNTSPATDSDWSYGCAFGDYDNDGFQDLAVATCRFSGIDRPDLLYHNDGNGNSWIMMKLSGTVSNRSAIGAKVRLKATVNGTPVWQMREVSSQSSYCGQNDMRVHFGLGNATIIDSIILQWPSGITEYYINMNVNQILYLTEGNTTGINEADRDFLAYPNPSTGTYTILSAEAFAPGDEIMFTDVNGIMIRTETIKSTSNRIECTVCSETDSSALILVTIRHKGKVDMIKIICHQNK